MRKSRTILLAIVLGLFSGVYFIDAMKSDISNECKLQVINENFNQVLHSFELIESALNTEEKLKLTWVKSFLVSKLEDSANVSDLTHVLKSFSIASMKLEILTVQQETKKTDFLFENAISDLVAQKIKLQLLHGLCLAYKNFSGKCGFTLSNRAITRIVLNSLPEKFKRSALLRILTWFKKSSRNISWIMALLAEDFYTKNIVEALEYLDLITDYRATVLGNKILNDNFIDRINDLISKLIVIEPSGQHMNAIVELLTAKLIQIKDLILMFDKNKVNLTKKVDKLQRFSKFKVLFQNKKFKNFRLDGRYTTLFDLFVSNVHQYFDATDYLQINLEKLFEIKQVLSDLRESKQQKSGLFQFPILGKVKEKNKSLIFVLEAMISILDGAIEEITGGNEKSSGGIIAGGMNLLAKLKNLGLDGAVVLDVANALFSKKFKSVQEAILQLLANITTKTAPVWLKKVVPFLPENLRGAAFAVLNALVDTKPVLSGISTPVSDVDVEVVVDEPVSQTSDN